MGRISRAIKLYKTNKEQFKSSLVNTFGFLFSDRKYLELLFKYNVGYELNLKNPKTYNEKLQWLKLYYHNPLLPILVDKYTVKEYVSNIIGQKYIIPSIGVWEKAEDIDWSKLPSQFVLKTTTGGGSIGVYICHDKSTVDKHAVIKTLNKSLKYNIYETFREWPYKEVKARIIAEELLSQEGKSSLNDYKVMCFNGKVKLIEYHEGRFTGEHTQDFYDPEWNLTSITQGSYGENKANPVDKPNLLNEMIRLSESLSKDLPHVRVDWYIVDNHLYFGEMTFFDGSGLFPWDRYEDDLLLGSWLTLPQKQ